MPEQCTAVDQAKLDAKMPLDELFDGGTSGYPLQMPVLLKAYISRYQKAYHKRHGERINRDKLLAHIIQRSLPYLVRETERMTEEVEAAS